MYSSSTNRWCFNIYSCTP